MEDEQIVTLYWDRDEAALQETEAKYDRYLTKIAYNILADMEDSRESVNDTYLAAWNSMPPQRPSVLSTYLGKLTRRISIDRFRYRTRDKRKDSQYALSLSDKIDRRLMKRIHHNIHKSLNIRRGSVAGHKYITEGIDG